jgi:hypothetical protein
MTSPRSITTVFSRSACAALLIAGVVGSAPVHAQEAIESVLGALGIKPSDGDNKYPERAPLVVPPSQKLPKPKKLSETGDANWVKDHDVTLKKAEDDKPYEPGTFIADLMTKSFPATKPTTSLSDPPSAVKKKAVITPEIEAATKAATGESKAWYQFW